MKLPLIFLLFLCGCSHYSQPEQNHTLSSSSFQPQPAIVIQRQGYLLAYDGRIRGASWVYEELTPSSLQGHIDRLHFDFMEDPKIPKQLRATKADFSRSGFDRGHLRPAANARSSEETMKETFYLSNISPQHPQLNRKYWLKLEKHVRESVKRYDILYVITGPLFLPRKAPDGKWYVRYEVIGENDIAVPTHYFKVLQGKKGSRINTEAFIIPNEQVSNDLPLKNFSVTLDKVEKAAGLIFNK
jgi:endonuclease G